MVEPNAEIKETMNLFWEGTDIFRLPLGFITSLPGTSRQ